MTEKYIAIGIYLVILAFITWFSARRKNAGDFSCAVRCFHLTVNCREETPDSTARVRGNSR